MIWTLPIPVRRTLQALALAWITMCGLPASAQLELDSLTDQELIDLYAATQQETLRDSVLDKSQLVGAGPSLIQFGYSYTTQADDTGLRYSTHTVPELLIRRRLTQRIEIRAAWSGVTFDRLHDETTGTTDRDSVWLNPSLGVRLGLWRQRGMIPQTSITASTPVDFNDNAGFLSRLNPQVAFGYSWLTCDRLLVTGSTGAVWTRDFNLAGDEDRFLDWQQSLSFDWLLTERTSLYFQWLALIPEGSRFSEIGHSIGPGLSVPVGKKTQLDVSTNFGLDDDSPDFGTQAFLSWRF